MKTVKLFLIINSFCMLTSMAFSQNRYWVIPPNYVDFYTGQVLPLPNTAISPATSVSFVDLIAGTTSTASGAPLNKANDYTYLTQRSSNGVFNENGELQYYLNNKAYATPGRTVVYKSVYGEELPILPVPENCDYYYLITDFTLTPFTLNYKRISLDGSVIISNSASIPKDSHPVSNMYHFAVSRLSYNTDSGQGFYKLYCSDYSYVYEFLVTASGISYSNRYLIYGSYSTVFCTEIEISNNGQYVARTFDWPGVRVTDVVSGVTTTYLVTGVGTEVRVVGIEFLDNKVFFTLLHRYPAPSQNKIGYFELGTGEFSYNGGPQYALDADDLTFVSNTESIPGSLIELAADGLMYISDGSYLRGFDPENVSSGIVKSIPVVNPITTSNTRNDVYQANFYTLVDQIDGVDHTNLFQVGCDVSEIVSNVSSANGTLSPIVKVSQTIETANSVTVAPSTFVTFKAGDQILLKPGFTVNEGGNFRGAMEECEDFVIDYCEMGARKANQEVNEEDELFINVFPNTTTGIINIKTSSSIHILQVEITASNGTKILNRKFNGVREATLDLTGYSQGVYIVRIKHNLGIETRKIILRN